MFIFKNYVSNLKLWVHTASSCSSVNRNNSILTRVFWNSENTVKTTWYAISRAVSRIYVTVPSSSAQAPLKRCAMSYGTIAKDTSFQYRVWYIATESIYSALVQYIIGYQKTTCTCIRRLADNSDALQKLSKTLSRTIFENCNQNLHALLEEKAPSFCILLKKVYFSL